MKPLILYIILYRRRCASCLHFLFTCDVTGADHVTVAAASSGSHGGRCVRPADERLQVMEDTPPPAEGGSISRNRLHSLTLHAPCWTHAVTSALLSSTFKLNLKTNQEIKRERNKNSQLYRKPSDSWAAWLGWNIRKSALIHKFMCMSSKVIILRNNWVVTPSCNYKLTVKTKYIKNKLIWKHMTRLFQMSCLQLSVSEPDVSWC